MVDDRSGVAFREIYGSNESTLGISAIEGSENVILFLNKIIYY